MRNIEVFGDRLIVKPVEEEATTESGIVLPQQSGDANPHQQGEVLVTGEDVDERLKVGASVIYSKYGGTDLEIDEEQVVVLRQADILVLLPD